MRVGAIYRSGRVVFPNGDLEIEERDRVIIFTLAERVRQVEQMFRVSLEFF
jgi:trk system potassium uptake protein TrkA